MFSFVRPLPDGSFANIQIGARTLDVALDQYKEFWWYNQPPVAVALFENDALIGRVIPVFNFKTDRIDPHFEWWK